MLGLIYSNYFFCLLVATVVSYAGSNIKAPPHCTAYCGMHHHDEYCTQQAHLDHLVSVEWLLRHTIVLSVNWLSAQSSFDASGQQ